AHRRRPDVPLVPVGRAAARDGTPGDPVRAHAAAAEPVARARASDRDALARLVAPVSAHVPLGRHEAREWRPHVAPPDCPGLPLLDPAAPALDRLVCAGITRVDAPGDDARCARDRASGAVAHFRTGPVAPGAPRRV